MAERQWDKFQRQEQGAKIQIWKPWLNCHGPSSSEGIKISRMNATRHGLCSEQILNLKKYARKTHETTEYEKSAKKYILALKSGDFKDLEDYDSHFNEHLKKIRELCEQKEDSQSKYFEFMYITSVYHKVLSALSKALVTTGSVGG
jgi:hypothetical protein